MPAPWRSCARREKRHFPPRECAQNPERRIEEPLCLICKQRAQLRGLAATEDTIVHIGKGGITDNIITQMSDALKARELVKGRVLENSLLSAREACDRLAEVCRAEPVQVIGSKFVLYKRNESRSRRSSS
ncbi:MAG: YhbY family RNA-binding protein [Oscillospiraceae bacterium]